MVAKITTTIAETRTLIAAARTEGRSIGFVPTMGALHAGHASLMKTARAENGFVVVSIFVNPTQFGPKEDFLRYPRPFDEDMRVCAAEGVDLIVQPASEIIYPPPFKTFIDVQELQDVLCGSTRPGHFRSVATVVLKLFNIVRPDRAYFGQKDAQQARILEQMVRDLNVPVEMKICPIVRESDGLAMSSRNVYLDAAQRKSATVLYRSLEAIREQIGTGERRAEPLIALARSMIEQTPGARLDYAAVVDFERLQPMDRLQGKVLIALAVFFGTTRLIDNLLVEMA